MSFTYNFSLQNVYNAYDKLLDYEYIYLLSTSNIDSPLEVHVQFLVENFYHLGGFHYMDDVTCFIIGHHHTYKAIDGIDFQILVEADYIVNLMEGYCKRESIPEMKKNVFKTESGLYLLQQMFEESKR